MEAQKDFHKDILKFLLITCGSKDTTLHKGQNASCIMWDVTHDGSSKGLVYLAFSGNLLINLLIVYVLSNLKQWMTFSPNTEIGVRYPNPLLITFQKDRKGDGEEDQIKNFGLKRSL